MPLSKYYGGHGREVAEDMKKRYGSDWKRVFYATENKHKNEAQKRALKRMK